MKPSDTPERRRERVQRHRRRKADDRIADRYVELGEILPGGTPLSAVIDRMIAEDFANIDLVADQVRYDLDLLGVLAERWGISGFLRCKPHRLALAAYEADRERVERGDRQRASKDACGWKKGVWTGSRAGEPWGNRYDRSRWRCFDTNGPEFEDFAELWGLNKRLRRFALRRKLRLKTGEAQWFEVARAASDIRRPPLSVFEAKGSFPTSREWYRRWDWPESWSEVKPARVRQIYRPPADELGIERGPQRFLWTRNRPAVLAGVPSNWFLRLKKPLERGQMRLVCSDYPRGWAAEPLKAGTTALQEKSARIRDHAEQMQNLCAISDAFEFGLERLPQAA